MLIVVSFFLLSSCCNSGFTIKNKVSPEEIQNALEGRSELNLQSLLGNKENIERSNGKGLAIIALEHSEQAVEKLMSFRLGEWSDKGFPVNENFYKELSIKDRRNSSSYHYAAELGLSYFLENVIYLKDLRDLCNFLTNEHLSELEEIKVKQDKRDLQEKITSLIRELVFINGDGKSPVSLLVDRNIACVGELFSYFPNLQVKPIDREGNNLISYCIKNNKMNMFNALILFPDELLSEGLNFTNHSKITPLMHSAMLDAEQSGYYCKKLLLAGAGTEFTSDTESLIIAGLNCNIEVIEALLSLGAMAPKIESKLKAFIRGNGVDSIIGLARFGLAVGDVALLGLGIPPLLTVVGSFACDKILERYLSRRQEHEEEKERIKKSLKNIESVRVNLNWLEKEKINYGNKEPEFFKHLSELFKKKVKIFTKGIEDLLDLDKNEHSICDGYIGNVMLNMKQTSESHATDVAKRTRELIRKIESKSKGRSPLKNNVIRSHTIPKDALGISIVNYNRQLNNMIDCYEKVKVKLKSLSRRWSNIPYGENENELNKCRKNITDIVNKCRFPNGVY